MNESMDQLQQVIQSWEKRYAAAVMAQREADIVLPFLRATVEELDAFRKSGKANGDGVEQVRTTQPAPVIAPAEPFAVKAEAADVTPEPVAAAPQPADVPAPQPDVAAPQPADVVEISPTSPFAAKDPEVAGEPTPAAAAEEAPATVAKDVEKPSEDSISSAFGRKSIASLIENAGKKEAAS